MEDEKRLRLLDARVIEVNGNVETGGAGAAKGNRVAKSGQVFSGKRIG